MSELLAIGYQFAQAFGLLTMLQAFFAAILGLTVVFYGLSYFRNR